MSVQDGDRPTARARPLVLPEIFDGQKSFDEWVSHFENVSAVNGWNDDDKLLWLKVRLTGKAHVAFAQLAHETQQSYTTAKQALINNNNNNNNKALQCTMKVVVLVYDQDLD